MRVLIVEDNQELGEYTQQGLRQSGFIPDLVGDLLGADTALKTGTFDAIVLDLGLPDGDGADWLQGLRAAGFTLPVLVLTARDALEDRLKGLDGGADDYVVKPVALAEIAARLRALARRSDQTQGRWLEAGNLRYDTVAREVEIDGEAVMLSRRDVDLLELLLRRQGRVVPRRLIEERIYSFDDEVGPNSLEVSIHRLRKRLIGFKASLEITTLRGIGYLLREIAS